MKYIPLLYFHKNVSEEKFRTPKIMNLLTCEDSSSNTKPRGTDKTKLEEEEKFIKYKFHIICDGSGVTCYISCVMCNMSHVTCNLSHVKNATATKHPPANSPIMHSRLVCKDPKKCQNQKKIN